MGLFFDSKFGFIPKMGSNSCLVSRTDCEKHISSASFLVVKLSISAKGWIDLQTRLDFDWCFSRNLSFHPDLKCLAKKIWQMI